MKKIRLTMAFALAVCGSIIATAQEMIPLWKEGKMPNSKGLILKDSVAQQRLYQVGTPRMYVYLAPKEINTGAAVLIVPGGGYIRLPETYTGNSTAKFFQDRGINAFIVCHRLPTSRDLVTRHTAPLQDAQRAMRIIRANAAKWDIDPERIGVNGTSAGAHVASTLGTHQEDISAVGDEYDRFSYKPAFIMLISGVLSMERPITHGVSRESLLGANPSDELVKAYSNENRVTSSTPPTLLIHADNDNGVSPLNSVRFYEACKKAKVSASLHIFPFGAHGLGVGKNPGSADMWPQLSVEWLKEMNIISTVSSSALHINGQPTEPPLYLVDDVEVQNISRIKREDIQSISFLTTEESKSKYGERGKNGVMLIATKPANSNPNF
ncbi:MAG: alpha/beta hydrolase [Bacteroidales bacterium]|jgi:acetyl esterase/lipase|nr:alpha/beta hydrolase [Bacteroidales bacterium]